MNLFASSCASAAARLRGHHQIDGVILNVRRDQNLVADRAQLQDLVARRAPAPPSISSFWMVRSTMVLSSARDGIAHQDLHQEPVELRFGQRIGSFHLDGVLGRHHQERRFQFVRRACRW